MTTLATLFVEAREMTTMTELMSDPGVALLVTADPRWRVMIEHELAEKERIADLVRRRERLERAACRARRNDDVLRASRYFAAADRITEMMYDECLDDPDSEEWMD